MKSLQQNERLHYHGVGNAKAAIQLASQIPNAVLQAAKAGVAAITAPGTVPKVTPAAAKQAHTTAAHPAQHIPDARGPAEAY